MIHHFIQESDAEFEKKVGTLTTDGGFIHDVGEGYEAVDFDVDTIKSFTHTQYKALLERVADYTISQQFTDPNQAGQFALHASGYNEALEDLATSLREEAKKIEV